MRPGFFARVHSPERDQRARGGTPPRHFRSDGQLNDRRPVPAEEGDLLNALGSSLPAGQKRERERRPERPRRALLHARGALCANAVHARPVLAERRRSRKRGGETQRPRRSLSEAAVKKCGVAFPRPRVNGSDTWARTKDPVINSHMLYQLSYVGTLKRIKPSGTKQVKPDVDVDVLIARVRSP